MSDITLFAPALVAVGGGGGDTTGGGSGDFTLSVNAYKVKGTQTADLSWSGAKNIRTLPR